MKLWKKSALIAMIAAATVLSGCGSEKVGVVDFEKIQNESPKIKEIQKEVINKDAEIRARLAKETEGLSEEEAQKKAAAAQQEQMIFVQSKHKQVESIVNSQCEAVAKEKGLSIVMHKSAVPEGAIDVTEDVLKKINNSGTTDIFFEQLEKIMISSQIYIKEKRWKQNVRYDVIGIKKDKSGNNKIDWIKNAF